MNAIKDEYIDNSEQLESTPLLITFTRACV